MLKKKVILGICGGIAAYKAAFLIRTLVKEGCEVKVVLTPSVENFITKLTLSTLSKNEVMSDYFDPETGNWENHVELGLWADCMVIAPATANTIGKMAHGICDNTLLAVYLAAKCPVFVAPAMDRDMWLHPSTQINIKKLTSHGNTIIPVGDGELASGLTGEGRMAEPQEIVDFLISSLVEYQPLKGKNILITAGPTFEPIDPVRFIGNRSSGKMGIALAEVAAELGGNVQLVLGPTHLRPVSPRINVINIGSADEMYRACDEHFKKSDVFIASAAVSDYKPNVIADNKIKKNSDIMDISLSKNIDILKHFSQAKTKNQITVGFALETENETEYALKKLKEKNLNFIVLNSLKDKGAGFGHDTNKVNIIFGQNKILSFELMHKEKVAKTIVNEIIKLI